MFTYRNQDAGLSNWPKDQYRAYSLTSSAYFFRVLRIMSSTELYFASEIVFYWDHITVVA